MKEKRIQFIINMITIINIIIIMILGYHIFINQKYSRVKVRKILEKNMYTNNYIIEIKNANTGTINRRITQNEKARKEELRINNEIMMTTWHINNLNIETSVEKYLRIESEETKDKISLLKDNNSYIHLIDNMAFFKYIKNEKYQDKECIVIAVSNTKNYKEDGQILWIDIEDGFVIRNDYYSNGELIYIEECKIEINTVGDNDIKVPSLEGYTLMEEHNGISIYEKNEEKK